MLFVDQSEFLFGKVFHHIIQKCKCVPFFELLLVVIGSTLPVLPIYPITYPLVIFTT